MEPEGSLPYSQAPVTFSYPEPTQSSPHNPFPLPQDPSGDKGNVTNLESSIVMYA